MDFEIYIGIDADDLFWRDHRTELQVGGFRV